MAVPPARDSRYSAVIASGEVLVGGSDFCKIEREREDGEKGEEIAGGRGGRQVLTEAIAGAVGRDLRGEAYAREEEDGNHSCRWRRRQWGLVQGLRESPVSSRQGGDWAAGSICRRSRSG